MAFERGLALGLAKMEKYCGKYDLRGFIPRLEEFMIKKDGEYGFES